MSAQHSPLDDIRRRLDSLRRELDALARLDRTTAGASVLLTGAQTVAGVKTFSDNIVASSDIVVTGKVTSVQPAVRAVHSAPVNIATATFTTLTFDSERYDTASMHGPSNLERLTAPIAGKYLVTAHISFAGNATGIRMVLLMHNNTTAFAVDTREPEAAGTNIHLSVSSVYQFAASAYATVRVYQDSGGDLAVQSNANYSPEFTMTYLSN